MLRILFALLASVSFSACSMFTAVPETPTGELVESVFFTSVNKDTIVALSDPRGYPSQGYRDEGLRWVKIALISADAVEMANVTRKLHDTLYVVDRPIGNGKRQKVYGVYQPK